MYMSHCCSFRFEVEFGTSLVDALRALGLSAPFAGGDITQVGLHWSEISGVSRRDALRAVHTGASQAGPRGRPACRRLHPQLYCWAAGRPPALCRGRPCLLPPTPAPLLPLHFWPEHKSPGLSANILA